jgi:hypothetical protein
VLIDIEIGQAGLEEVFILRGHAEPEPLHGSAHPALQGGAALLEGRLPDRGRAGADLAALPADLFARAGRARQVYGIAYTAFLVPGLVMMSVLQNAFANSRRRR